MPIIYITNTKPTASADGTIDVSGGNFYDLSLPKGAAKISEGIVKHPTAVIVEQHLEIDTKDISEDDLQWLLELNCDTVFVVVKASCGHCMLLGMTRGMHVSADESCVYMHASERLLSPSVKVK